MKKILIIAAGTLMAVSFSSCKKFLEKPSANRYDAQTIFESLGRAEEVVVGCYGQTFNREEYYQLGMGTDECMSTESESNSKNQIGNYVYTASIAPTSTYTAMYAAIEYANVAIAGLPGVPVSSDADKAKLNMLTGEAYAIRAECYLNLLRFFGDVPYSTVPVAQSGVFVSSRTSRDVIYDGAVADLQKAADLLPWKSAGMVSTAERFTKNSALGMLARVCLYAAGYSLRWDLKTYSAGSMSISQRPDATRIKQLYQIAADACKQVIDRGENSLDTSFETVFRNLATGVYDNETMLEYGQWGTNNGAANGYTNGIYIHASSSFLKTQPAMAAVPTYYFDFATGDTRRDVTICNYGINSDNGHDMNSYSSNTVGKFRANWGKSVGTAVDKRDIDWPILRYSDVLLMYAEALNELNNGPTAEAKSAYEKVRLRGFANDATKIGTTPSDYQGFRNAIINERKFEFGFESLRRTDLERWGILYETLTATKQKLVDMANHTGAYANIDRYRVYTRTVSNTFPDPMVAVAYTGYATLTPADSTTLAQSGKVVRKMYGVSPVNSQGELRANSAQITGLYRGLEKAKVEILPLAQSIIDGNPGLKGEQQPKY